MKKLVSLLLAVMLVMSMMTFSVSASTDTTLYPNPKENELEIGSKLATEGNNNFSTNGSGNVVIIADENDADNRIFQIRGDKLAFDSSAVLCSRLTADGSALHTTSSVNRFSAKIMLPTVDDPDAVTEVFIPRGPGGYTTTCARGTTFGVTLKDGGAYYYDAITEVKGDDGSFVPFIENGTMEADKWYRIEAIMDNRETTDSEATSKVYMNAVVYDVETGGEIGKSGWVYVGNTSTYGAGQKSYLSTQIQAYKYDEGEVVLVDEYTSSAVGELPRLSVGIGEPQINKFVSTKSGWANPSTGKVSTFRTVGEWFTTSTSTTTALISADSANKAVRFEASMRFPELPTAANNTFTLFKIASAIPYKQDKAEVFDGTVQINKNGVSVKSYNVSTSKYDTVENLSNNSTAYPIEANVWYTFVWDIDFSAYATPKASLTVKDTDGNILVTTASKYNVAPLVAAKGSNVNEWNQAMILWAGVTNKDMVVHIDNTKVYGASTLANLDVPESRTATIDDDYESHVVGTLYNAIVSDKNITTHMQKTVTNLHVTIEVASDLLPPAFISGKTFESTEPFTLTFTYSNPIVAKTIDSNIEVYADGEPLFSGFDIKKPQVNNGCVDQFELEFNQLSYGTDYVIRLKAGLADYNDKAITGGMHAFPGLHRDIRFSIEERLTPDCIIIPEIIEGDGTASGKVTFTNKENGPLYCYAILAVYQGQKLVDIKKSELITVDKGANNFQATVDAVKVPEGATTKLFVWNNFENMVPWKVPVVLGN